MLEYKTLWINFEDIMTNERSQSQKDKYCMFPFMQGTSNSQIHKDREQNSGCQSSEDDKSGWLLFNGCVISVWKDKKFWRWMAVIVAQQCECT